MNEDRTIDLIRWTFSVDSERSAEIQQYLIDLGLDVLLRSDGSQIVATWDEPEGELDEVVEHLWAINGAPFEVTHEAFHRLELLAYTTDPEQSQDAE
jgi:hypothetical protein